MPQSLDSMIHEYKTLRKACYRKDGELRANANIDKVQRMEFLRLKIGEMEKVEEHVDPVDFDSNDLPEEDQIKIEREIRRYVKKSGGFRKGLENSDRDRAVTYLELLGRGPGVDEKVEDFVPQWDESILVPGFYDA